MMDTPDADPQQKKKFSREQLKPLIGIFRFVLPYKTTFMIGLSCLIISSIIIMGFPFLAGKLLDAASGKTDWILTSVNQISLALIIILLVQGILSYFRIYLFAVVSEKAMADVRFNLYDKLISLPVAFFDKSRVGELMSRITADVSQLHSAFTNTLAEFIRQILTLLVGTILIIVTTPKLTGFMFAIFPLLVVLGILFGRFIRRLSRKTQDELANTNIIVEETFQVIRMVKAFTNEVYESLRYKKSLNKVIKVALKTAKYRGLFATFIIFGLFGAIVSVMWYGATLVQSGEITVGDLLSFILYTTFIGGSIGGLGHVYGEIQRVLGASERILEIQDEEPESYRKEAENPEFSKIIHFCDVTFSYPTRDNLVVLNNISFDIEPGQKIALIGPSGAGKSTITQLLLRFYEPDSGGIYLKDVNIARYNLKEYRKAIAVVPQEILLFGGTIYENIIYGNPNAPKAEVIEASRNANALQFIEEFPDGFETIVGERGIKLSGGQKQRVAIARALLKDPELLILDEATSSLDSESELLVQQALNKLMSGRTSIIIAHRLSTVRMADKILVLKDGSIIESGTHHQLVQNESSNYSQLIKLQFQDA